MLGLFFGMIQMKTLRESRNTGAAGARLPSKEAATFSQSVSAVALFFVLCITLCALASCEPAHSSEFLGTFRISHYCHCSKCCGKSDGIMASGKKVYPGAVALNWLPFGTKLKITGIPGIFTVEDNGAVSIFGSKKNPKKALDIYVQSHSDALKHGVFYAEVWK